MNMDMGLFVAYCVGGCIAAFGIEILRIVIIKRAEKAVALQKAEWEKRQEEIEKEKAERKKMGGRT